MDQAGYFIISQVFSSIQKPQLNKKAGINCNGIKHLQQVDSGIGGASGCQQVVVKEYPVGGGDCILMDLDRVGAVFQLIILGVSFGRQLTRLSDGNKTGTQLMCNSPS